MSEDIHAKSGGAARRQLGILRFWPLLNPNSTCVLRSVVLWLLRQNDCQLTGRPAADRRLTD